MGKIKENPFHMPYSQKRIVRDFYVKTFFLYSQPTPRKPTGTLTERESKSCIKKKKSLEKKKIHQFGYIGFRHIY